MTREIQIVTVAFIVNESHSNDLNFALHASRDQNPLCSVVYRSRNDPFPNPPYEVGGHYDALLSFQIIMGMRLS